MGYKIMSGKYETGTDDQKIGFNQLLGNENIQEKFDLYFHWFNIIHELGHILVDIQNINMDSVDEELFVNSFAIAYWRCIDQSNHLEQLQHIISKSLSNTPNPIPMNVSFKDFFKSIWGSDEMLSVMMYGYFQLSCVIEAFQTHKSFTDLLSEIGYSDLNTTEMNPYNETINAENSHKVLSHCLTNLSKIGVIIKDVDIELVDNPEIQCCRPV